MGSCRPRAALVMRGVGMERDCRRRRALRSCSLCMASAAPGMERCVRCVRFKALATLASARQTLAGVAMRPRSHSLSLLFCTLLAACGGGGGGGPAPAPPPAPGGNQPPVASFTAPATLVAAGVAGFDARGSSDPEGSTLNYRWDFGDGNHGGAAQIAHLYPAAGRYSVRLTVTDVQGASHETTREITVTPSAATPTAQVTGLVKGTDGLPLAGANVGVAGGASPVVSDAQGRVSLTVNAGAEVALRVSRTGYADQTHVLHLPASVGSDGYFEATLMPRAAA
ncbi:MAG: PKD domain-containing protein, partial [Rhizobacter sp.]|nr:PKD domain-containing protein [Rhizobacter sp.]